MIIDAEDAREAAEFRAKELEPAAQPWTTMAACYDDMSVDHAAKVLSRDANISTGRNRLFASMAGAGWIYRSGERKQWHAYQTQIDVSWGGVTASLAGRTLEEAFAFENLSWCQDPDRTELKLRIPKSDKLTLGQLTESLHKRIKSTTFKKTDFALALLAEDPSAWVVPTYIAQGLRWLEDQVTQAPPAPVVAEVSIIA